MQRHQAVTSSIHGGNIKLYGFPLSPNTRKVIAVAKHLGLPLELQVVDLGKGEQRRPEFMKLNPNAKTPVLVDGDFVLWESTAIMEYLASNKTGNSLWPNDARQRADISRWLCWTIAHWGPACGIFLWENMIKKMLNMGEPDAAKLKDGETQFQALASVLDSHLKGREYLTGSQVTLADFSAASWIAYADAACMPWAPYSSIKNWYARIDKLPAWRDSAPKTG